MFQKCTKTAPMGAKNFAESVKKACKAFKKFIEASICRAATLLKMIPFIRVFPWFSESF